jgi:sugar phosphate isomerase/epimerase
LAAVFGGAAAAAIGGNLLRAEEPAGKKSPLKIGCGTVVFRKHTLREALERIRRAGYDYFETQATGPWCPHVDPWKDDPQAFRRLVSEFGFKGVSGLWSANGAILGDAKSVEGISQTIRWAKEAGIPVVHAGDGAKPGDMSDEDAMKLLGERLAKILEVAEKCHVYLGIEPHGSFSLTSDGLRKIMGLSPSKWLGINYDTANVHRATYVETAAGAYSWKLFGKRQDEVATLKTIVDRVVHVHVKDIVGTACVAIGKGEVNVAGCVAVLRDHGYQGVFSLETEGEQSLEENQQLIETSRKYLAGL